MKKGDKCTLIADISEQRQGKNKLLGRAGDEVTVTYLSYNVAIVEAKDGTRFTAVVDNLKEVPGNVNTELFKQ